MSKTHNEKIFFIVDNINGDLTKICFCKLYISAKITQNAGIKPLSEITINLSKIFIDF